MLWLLLQLMLCRSIEIPNFSQAIVAFRDTPHSSVDDLLDILGNLNVSALFLVDPSDGDFNSNFLKKLLDEGHTIGLSIPQSIATLHNVKSKLKQAKKKFNEIAGFDPVIVSFDVEEVTNIMKTAAAECNLKTFKASLPISSKTNLNDLVSRIEELDTSKGRVSTIISGLSVTRIQKILQHIMSKYFIFVHPDTYLETKMRNTQKIISKKIVNPKDDYELVSLSSLSEEIGDILSKKEKKASFKIQMAPNDKKNSEKTKDPYDKSEEKKENDKDKDKEDKYNKDSEEDSIDEKPKNDKNRKSSDCAEFLSKFLLFYPVLLSIL